VGNHGNSRKRKGNGNGGLVGPWGGQVGHWGGLVGHWGWVGGHWGWVGGIWGWVGGVWVGRDLELDLALRVAHVGFPEGTQSRAIASTESHQMEENDDKHQGNETQESRIQVA
jgi:hypothetical protein